MAAKEYLLRLPEIVGETIRLFNPCIVGYEADGRPIMMDTLDPRSFGRSFLAQTGPDTLWHARTECKSLDALKDLHGFHGGAIVSPRARAIIEQDGVPNIEFIPVEVQYKDTGTVLGTWWFVNVFNWRSAFDFSRSEADYVDFQQPIKGLREISHRFGERALRDWDVLEVNQDEITDGLFLAKAPSERIWGKVFIAERLARKLNEGLPKKRIIEFSQFWLDRGPGPKFDLSGYRYAGRSN